MVEIYLVVSVAPIPLATLVNRDWGTVGSNYLKSLLALGFQGFLIMVCVAIYSALIAVIGTSDNLNAALWQQLGTSVLLVLMLFKTGAMAKSIFNSH
jgi:Ca2+/Na+ antiporter